MLHGIAIHDFGSGRENLALILRMKEWKSKLKFKLLHSWVVDWEYVEDPVLYILLTSGTFSRCSGRLGFGFGLRKGCLKVAVSRDLRTAAACLKPDTRSL